MEVALSVESKENEAAEPIGGATGDEPFRSVEIAVSVAAHPCRSPLAFDDSKAMRLRVLVGLSCLAIIVLVMALLFGERSGGSLAVKKERVLMRSLRTPFSLETWSAQHQNLDTNAIPVLAKALATRPGVVDKAYTWAWSNATVAIRSNLPQPLDSAAVDQIRLRASALLADPKIGDFVPPSTLVKELRDPSWGIRMNALACLNNAVLPKSGPDGLREEKGTILTLVLAAAQDSRWRCECRRFVAWGISRKPLIR